MQKKKFDLTSDIINVNLDEAMSDRHLAPKEEIERTNIEKKVVLVTLSVEEELRKEYKTWCASKGLKMNEAFLKGFDLLKKNYDI